MSDRMMMHMMHMMHAIVMMMMKVIMNDDDDDRDDDDYDYDDDDDDHDSCPAAHGGTAPGGRPQHPADWGAETKGRAEGVAAVCVSMMQNHLTIIIIIIMLYLLHGTCCMTWQAVTKQFHTIR